MSKRKPLPSYRAILDYWTSLRYEDYPFPSFFIDWGEPTCWSCGEFWEGRYDFKGKGKLNVPKLWEKAPLERCHIIPDSLGGSNGPENIFLMCNACHLAAPNTTSRNLFFKWVEKQDWLENKSEQIKMLLKTFDIDLKECISILKNKKFPSFFSKNVSAHFGEGYNYSSIISATKSFKESKL